MPATLSDTREATYSTEVLPGFGPAREERPNSALWRRVAGLLTPVFRTHYRDPLFERPDVIEDDYYRFRHQPRD